MFLIYLWRELRRRVRQAVFIALGLALGIGLVITVTAASSGVQDAQGAVLHSLYGIGTDVTVTQPPPKGQSTVTAFGFRQDIQNVRKGVIAPGTSININILANSQYGTIPAALTARVRDLRDVTGAAAGLALTDVTVTGTVPSISSGGSFSSSFQTGSFSVAGVDLSATGLGALSSARAVSGRDLTAADASASVAVLDSGYATQRQLATGSKITIGSSVFTVVGIVSVPQGGTPTDVYIPLARAQAIGRTGSAALAGRVNTIYVAAASAADIPAVQQEISRVVPGATVTDQDNLASQVTGSLSNASSLASSLGRWLSVAVLIAAFGLASLLTMAAVARRVREFGTLKALGWRSRRIVVQVMGESLVTGVIGGAAGIGLGYGGAALIDRLAPRLSATVGAAAPGGTAGRGGGVAGALRAAANASHTISVTLTAPVTVHAITLAVVLAVAGGLIAGTLGGWRAARMRPAAALARVE